MVQMLQSKRNTSHASRVWKSTRHEKVVWLADHPEFLNGTKVEIANALKSAGLVSFTTSPCDLGISRLVAEAELVRERREEKR